MALTLWREGKDILHPVTKAVIGRTEEEVGTVEVTAVGDGASTAVIKRKLKDPKPGDKARITPKKINLAIVPLRADKPEIITGLATRLGESGRFSVLESEKVDAFLKDRKVKDTALIKEMGRAFDLDAAATVGIYPSDDKLLITTKIYYADDGRLLDTVIATLALSSKNEALGDLRPFSRPIRQRRTALRSFLSRRAFCLHRLRRGRRGGICVLRRRTTLRLPAGTVGLERGLDRDGQRRPPALPGCR